MDSHFTGLPRLTESLSVFFIIRVHAFLCFSLPDSSVCPVLHLLTTRFHFPSPSVSVIRMLGSWMEFYFLMGIRTRFSSQILPYSIFTVFTSSLLYILVCFDVFVHQKRSRLGVWDRLTAYFFTGVCVQKIRPVYRSPGPVSVCGSPTVFLSVVDVSTVRPGHP